MKKSILLALALVMVILLMAACGNNDDEPEVTPPPTLPPATDAVVEVEPPAPPPEIPDEPTEEPVPEPVVFERPVGVLWSLSTDEYIQNLAPDTRNDAVVEGSPFLYTAGDPVLALEEWSDGFAISISGRNQNHYTLDIVTGAFNWDFANNTYMLTVNGTVEDEVTIVIGGADSPWDWLSYADVRGNFTVHHIIEGPECLEAAGSRQHFRVQTNCTSDFVIRDITLSLHSSSQFPRAENVVYSLSTDPMIQLLEVGTFETRDYDIVLATPILSSAGDPRYEIIAGPYGNGIEIRNRMANHYAVDLIAPAINWDFDNHTYTVNVRGNVTAEGQFIIGGADNPWDWLAYEYTDAEGNFDVTLLVDHQDVITSAGSRNWFRMQSNCTEHFTIHEIEIIRQ
ncbi:MAG: hypothetical protein FWF81_15235 [Defluviitaleaceae bacterium]|nr:hypothetical protein [Defluviitaleaceae bacterium]